MAEKLDLDGLKQALINSAMGLTFRECHALIDYAQSLEADNLELCGAAQAADAERRALESRASNAGGAVAAGHFVLRNGLWYDVGPEHRMAQPLYTHPAPASKEPVADERAAEFDNLIDVYQSAQKDGNLDDRANARGALKAAFRAALAAAQPLWRSGGKDTERLDWLAQHGAWIAWGRDGEMCRVFHHSDDEDGRAVPFCGWGFGKCYPTAREAIDAAMLAAAQAKPEGV